MKIGPNSHVVLEYVLRDDDGDILDSSDAEDGAPIVYVHGYGMLVPGLEKALVGLEVGAKRDVKVPPEEGFGEHDEELVIEIDRADAPRPDKVAVGDELVAESPEGDEIVMHVVEVTADAVVLDGNHPLAGATLHYSVTIREVRPATEEEISEAASAFEEAAGLSGNDAPDLIQLGKPRPQK
jgi:FKBP-type peptidyl-prolyl cis-trans isomerase SlyD